MLATVALLAAVALPVRGLHLSEPSAEGLPKFCHFIRDALPKEGINTLVVEFDYGYKFKTHPEVANPGALDEEQVGEIVAACKDANVRLIPQINMLGHQSWAETTFGLLRSHPEFDETPGKFPGNKGLYCRSYCPLVPGVHSLVFDLIDELADACHADAFHVGMDEVMTLGDPDCPRCKDIPKAKLFADEVNRLHDHLRAKGLQMWMWGDRFLDGKTTGIGDWAASGNDTQDAIRSVPHDIVICDWQYDHAEPTAGYFALSGFPIVTCPWRNSKAAVQQLADQRHIHSDANRATSRRAMGMMETTWIGADRFIDTYYGTLKNPNRETKEVVQCFKDLCAAQKK